LHRNERLIALLRSMLDRPGNAFTLGGFAERFGAARSTISEDLALIRRTLEETGGGTIETLPGATGGARFLPLVGKQELAGRLDRLCEELADPSRIIPGGFLYMTDVIFSPTWASWIGEIFATVFYEMRPGYVVTIETKGIPLALMTARALGTPLVIVRRESRVTEGSTVSINYVSASSQRIQRMCLPRRALPSGSRALVIDDFMRGGGTARAMADLLGELDVEVAGTGVLMASSSPARKQVSDYVALLRLGEIDEAKAVVRVEPGDV